MTHGWKVGAVRGAMRAAQFVSTGTAAWLADRVFCTPPSSRVPRSVHRVMAAAERSFLLCEGRRVATWRWGRGPTVALVHGWGSRAARLMVYVEPLVERGFSVVAFDAPAHGESEGRLGSGVQAARALLEVGRATPLYGVIGHSLGAAATMLALEDGLQLQRAVFIAPPADLKMYTDRLAEVLDLTPTTLEAMRRRIERRLRFSWQKLDFDAIAAGVRGVDLLLFHDRDDRDVAWENSRRIAAAWRGAQLRTTEGLGHHQIARDPGIVAEAVSFLAAKTPLRAAAVPRP
jgi:pimeloyl-ACP methyl ester carboxylesterase